MREWIFAVLLALAAGAITHGVATFSTGAAWIVGGILFGLLAREVVAE